MITIATAGGTPVRALALALLSGVLVTTAIPAGLSLAPASVVSTQTGNPGSGWSTAGLNSWLPSSVQAQRASTTTCLVSWVPDPAAPAGTSYDVTDGAGSTAATAVSGSSATIAVPAIAVSPTVLTRYGSWVSATAVTSASVCPAAPGAPAVTATPGQGQVTLTWTAAAPNAGAVSSYTAAISPGSASCTVPGAGARTCTFTGLTDGDTYTFSVAATNSAGTGPSGGASAIPYPATIMTSARLALWLDGADAGTLLASPSCSGALASGPVGCWLDKSAQANNAVQASAGNRPALGLVTGRMVPQFDGSTSYLGLDPTRLPVGGSTGTIAAVATLTDPTPASSAYRDVLNYGTLIGGQARQLQKGSGSSAILASDGPDVASQGSWGAGPTIVTSQFASSSIDVSSSGRQPVSTSASVNTTTTYADVGSSGTPGQFWFGRIPEIMVFTGGLSASERRQIEEYLSRKWNTTIAPQSPGTPTLTAGDSTADVSWSAPAWDGGAAVSSYTATAVPSDGSATRSCTASTSPCTLTGLFNGVTYDVSVAATNANGTGPASAVAQVFTYPSVVTTAGTMSTWFDADDASTLRTPGGAAAGPGDPIATWQDRSPGSLDASQPTSVRQPVLDTLAGRGAVLLTNANWLDGPSGTFQTIVAVADPNRSLYYNTLFAAPAETDYSFRLINGAPNPSPNVNDWVVPTAANSWADGVTTNGVAPAAGPAVFTAISAAAHATTFSLSTSFAPSGTPLRGLQGRLGELMTFNRALTPAERRSVEEYQAHKWGVTMTPGLPVGPSAAPGNTTATVSWSPPSWTGGSAISSYTITPSGPGSCTWGGASSASCTGLTHGVPYTFAVLASNSVGAGSPISTAAVTP